MNLIQEASKLGYKHYTEFTIEELDKLPLNNPNKQIEYYFIFEVGGSTTKFEVKKHTDNKYVVILYQGTFFNEELDGITFLNTIVLGVVYEVKDLQQLFCSVTRGEKLI